ncbi:hypothetical protein [Persicobacter sp. CCB-QB2]|uniref:hypothetical protein n=1 Tax=Persicobacter sp. CCB-QB2 TaxID=1561025 RepID=UPI0012FB70D1|nr:hypothetical protein [Persicobacter sp. CCB-QB2]
MKNILVKFLSGLIASFMLFFSISFMTVIPQLHSFLFRPDRIQFKIGFPLVYYQEMLVDCPDFNYHWSLANLLLDFGIGMLLVMSGYAIFQKYVK